MNLGRNDQDLISSLSAYTNMPKKLRSSNLLALPYSSLARLGAPARLSQHCDPQLAR